MSDEFPQRRRRSRGVVLSTLAGIASVTLYLLWQLVRYTQRLFRQPRLATAVSLPTDYDIIQARGLAIARENLLSGLEERYMANGETKMVLCAGRRNFREPWARDFGFASFGLMALGEETAVREGLEVFFAFQSDAGQFPVKVHSTSIVDRYAHSLFGREQPIDKPLRPKYITAHNTISLDGNCLLIIAALNYAAQTGDDAFANANWHRLKQAIGWLEDHVHEEDGLLHQAPFTDWADSVGRAGRILYTNVLYWKALHEMARAAKKLSHAPDQAIYTLKAATQKRAIQHHFWRNDLGYFVTSQEFTFLSSSGNLLAIAWDLATPEQARRILDTMDHFGMADPVPTQVTHLAYPNNFIAIENRLAGIPEYHTHAAWLWLGGWHVVALTRAGRLARARELLDRLDWIINRDGVVHEVYGKNGRYLSTFWYTSEAPLTWNAGLVVYAHHVLTQAQAK